MLCSASRRLDRKKVGQAGVFHTWSNEDILLTFIFLNNNLIFSETKRQAGPQLSSVCSVAQSWPTLCHQRLQPTRLPCSWDFSGKNNGVGCYFLLQGIFPTQGLNPHLLHLLHWQTDSHPLSYLGR